MKDKNVKTFGEFNESVFSDEGYAGMNGERYEDRNSSEIIERFEKEFGDKDFSTQEFAEFYHVLRTEGFDGIEIMNTLGDKIK